MDGILNINKPEGKTSYRVVASVKELTGEKRVGHAGTLDPTATGVLPIFLGQGTRLIEFLASASKTYQAEIELGITTDTYDATGRVIEKRDPSGISLETLKSALASFRGIIQQMPPMYSAVRHHGQRLHRLARAGIEVERRSRPAQIHRLDITGWAPPVVKVTVECSKGTYIRSLAHDLGQVLGCGAMLKSLVRTGYGPFEIENALSLPQFEEACRRGSWKEKLYPLDIVLRHMDALILNEKTAAVLRSGAAVALTDTELSALSAAESEDKPHQVYRRAYTADGRFLGVLRLSSDRSKWQPVKIFRQIEQA